MLQLYSPKPQICYKTKIKAVNPQNLRDWCFQFWQFCSKDYLNDLSIYENLSPKRLKNIAQPQLLM